MVSNEVHRIARPLSLPCGATFKNRIAKSAMSDSLGDGEGNPTEEQPRLYERWAEGGASLIVMGEVQGDPCFPESPGNLVLLPESNRESFKNLTACGTSGENHLWAQLGHAGALSHAPVSLPKGPSRLCLDSLECAALTKAEIANLPSQYAKTASLAKSMGYTGVQIHAGHGFLLSQFLSPLFNRREDEYGGVVSARCRVILDIICEVRAAVGPSFPIGIRINSTDQLAGGLTELEALEALRLLDKTSIDLIDISGGTYFPGVRPEKNNTHGEPYFLEFARHARKVTDVPLMLTGGIKTKAQAARAVNSGIVDMVGLARALVIEPGLPNRWLANEDHDVGFPRFKAAPPGGITAWYTMRLTALALDREDEDELDVFTALRLYKDRDEARCIRWNRKYKTGS